MQAQAHHHPEDNGDPDMIVKATLDKRLDKDGIYRMIFEAIETSLECVRDSDICYLLAEAFAYEDGKKYKVGADKCYLDLHRGADFYDHYRAGEPAVPNRVRDRTHHG